MSLRAAWRVTAALPRVYVPSRSISKKVLANGGISRLGDAPGFPKDTSSHVIVPGENEEPNQQIGGFSWLGDESMDEVATVPFGTWTPESKRTGAIGRKMGMMNVWDARGVKTLCTVIKIDACQVIAVKKYISGRGTRRINLSLGAGTANVARKRKAQIVPFRKAGVPVKIKLADFAVTPDGVLPIGTTIDVRHFVPGQYIDIIGTSRPKGIQGGMKRWGFGGGFATHGNSLAHRSIGATGACQDPGKTWKGKKMAGHTGDRRCTFLNNLVYKVDVKRNLLFISGTVPGRTNTFLALKDAVRKKWSDDHPPPFPTFIPNPDEETPDEIIMDVSHMDNPFAA